MAKTVYRPGDIVRVVNSRFIERVGYPLVFTELRAEFDNHPQFFEAMRLLGVIAPDAQTMGWRAKRDAVEGLAKAAVRARGWGGKERRIHYKGTRAHAADDFDLDFTSTGAQTDCAGLETEVYAKKVRMTGDYYPPWSGQTYEGEYDFEPGGLSNARAHVILSTGLGDIEACDVELVRAAEPKGQAK